MDILVQVFPFENQTKSSGFHLTFENQTIRKPDKNWPFEYRTSPVFGCLLKKKDNTDMLCFLFHSYQIISQKVQPGPVFGSSNSEIDHILTLFSTLINTSYSVQYFVKFWFASNYNINPDELLLIKFYAAAEIVK